MDSVKTATLTALRLVLKPIVRIMLRAGVNWREFAEAGKATFVEIASEDFGIRGRPTNVSRVSILTGFTRKEVRRLRDLLESEDAASFEHMNQASRILTGWFTDREFTDADGMPLGLSAAGPGISFRTLCAKYGGDVAETTMLKELKHVGAVTEEDGILVARTRYYMPVLMDPEQILRSGSVVEDLGNTVAYNLHRKQDDAPRFERRATNAGVPAEAIPAFREFIDREGQAFLEKVDAWLSEHENGETGGKETVRLGLGAYWIEDSRTSRITK